MDCGVMSPLANQMDDVAAHAPATQAWLVEQACPQLPQLCGSVCTVVQTPEQAVHPGWHTIAQLPPEHAPTAFIASVQG
jgi:hypothetical protein